MKKILFAFMALTIGLLTSCGGDDDIITVTGDKEKTAVLDITNNISTIKGYVDTYNALPENMKALGLALLMSEVDGLKINLKGFEIEAVDGITGPALMEGELPYINLYLASGFEAVGEISSTNQKIKVKSVELVHHHSVMQDEMHYKIFSFGKEYKYKMSNDEFCEELSDNFIETYPFPTYDREKKSDVFDLTSNNGKFSLKTGGSYFGYLRLSKIIVKYEVLE